MRYIIYVLTLALATATTSLQAQSMPGPGHGSKILIEKNWPQSFDLHGTSSVRYGLEVSSPGTINIMVQWQGDPLTLVLTRPDGQKIYINARATPGQFPVNATTSDLRAGTVWQLEIYPTLTKVDKPGTDPNARHEAKGSVSVQVPSLAAAPYAGDVPLPTAPGTRPGSHNPQTNSLTPDNYPTCFAFTPGNGGQVGVQCFGRRDWCDEHVRNKTVDGGTKFPNMVVVLGCTRGPLYCYSYNNGNSGACFADGNECVNNRNSFAGQQRGAAVGICRDYTGGMVRN